MPFTFAHPAIVLPLRNSHYFYFPALLIGSMTPDFEYFFRMQAYSTYSYTLFGMFYFDIPLVIGLWMLYAHSWLSFVIFLYSALLGIFSHLVWDAFTHKGAFAVAQLPILSQHLLLGAFDLPVYKVLQHGSTCIGFATIAFVIWKRGKGRTTSVVARALPAWLKCLYCLGIVAGGVAVAYLHLLATNVPVQLTYLLSGVVPFLSGSMLTLIVLSWVVGRFILKK